MTKNCQLSQRMQCVSWKTIDHRPSIDMTQPHLRALHHQQRQRVQNVLEQSPRLREFAPVICTQIRDLYPNP